MSSQHHPHYFKPEWIENDPRELWADVVIYGGTAAGVVAAKALAERGRSVLILNPAQVLGGMTTGGLGWTDFGKKGVIGGMSRRFYEDLGAHYGLEGPAWTFEPKAAQAVIDCYASNARITVLHRQFLKRVELDAGKIVAVEMLGGLLARGRYFMDCTYEGDLLGKAGVSYTVGREANRVYGETINGVQIRPKHQFSHPVDPYVIPGDPKSGTLPWVYEGETAPEGSGDHKIQAYNFRVCMTDDPELKVDWVQPEGFRELDHELARRWFNTETDDYNAHLPNGKNDDLPEPESILRKFDVMEVRTKNGYLKTDTNNHGPVSTDFIGANYAWPEASYAQREVMFQEHYTYIMGHFWFMANDPSIPEVYRKGYARFGLPKDEFPLTGHWPHQLYVREARRMVGDYVLNEKDTQHHRQPEDPIAMGSYAMDSHNCQRFVRNGCVTNEGDVQLKPAAPYGVSYRSIVPARGQCPNLFVPVCLSASHIAYGSVRMEPVFMAIGESAAVAADLALETDSDVQDLDYSALKARLESVGQVLTYQVAVGEATTD
ncbi:FAD-dependent oxidoreductase [Coraliomargarita parva]|uniref:FAD-dependent oxidoreductase n=1 Tax=Coraliomargarita parva TaxID=3014050 RepID=UPI0022B5D6AA|nr:FAD-dependent oxidoreductase [Coraliomargarita parva]